MGNTQGNIQNRWIKVLCFGQSHLIFADKFTERLVKPAFTAMMINMWSLIFCILLLVMIVGSWLWKPFSLLLQPYSKAIFITWSISAFIFLATMHFVGYAGQAYDAEKKSKAEKGGEK